MTIDFKNKLEALRKGEIDEFEVDRDTFSDFYKIWNVYNYQSGVKGFAQKGGKVIYRRKEKVK
ncbi:hypothetical protein [Oenococcus kitaharae]|uniref:Phage protein n=1 Tax=Oenococcus kitaharae DSM 17330 TaxID=1045004 RepID=G9WI57_9LACO|nr:hypothetical protein [Oenococcus kitaharae]EHN59179.1 hypothetical protein OKIT_1076 [Oenococcus kitaharae DSM 17330]OEY81946.1 hypothetical protein NV75_08570 [Oenococcus kitaharae]OEY82317.1 hypothetical protein NT95_06360 [Oenococcus kitaharae]OEY82723.1 hypothetical protein NT96_06000 [Oenococcus kitaharae]